MKLLRHFQKMQAQAANYLEPRQYMPLFGPPCSLDMNSAEEKTRFIQDMVYALDGPEQREAQAEAEFDYVAETERTNSGLFYPEKVSAEHFAVDLQAFIDAGERMNLWKKVLFRGHEPSALGLVDVRELGDSDKYKSLAYFFDDKAADLLHGIVGIATESAELAEIPWKWIALKKPFDTVNVREEMGDVLWYMSRLMKWADTSFFAEMVRNINKLLARHGKSFNFERDNRRDYAKERSVLSGGAIGGDVFFRGEAIGKVAEMQNIVTEQFQRGEVETIQLRDELGLPLPQTVSIPRRVLGAKSLDYAPDERKPPVAPDDSAE